MENLTKTVKEISVHKGKFLEMCIKQIQSDNSTNTAEFVRRPNKPEYKPLHGTECLAIFKPEEKVVDVGELSLLIIENFRFPVEKHVLELPAGLIENSEYDKLRDFGKSKDDPEYETILTEIIVNGGKRELEEETGYSGEFKGFLNVNSDNNFLSKIGACFFTNLYYSPWISDENSCLVLLEIDKSKQKTIVKQSLENEEIIKTYEVKVKDLMNFINQKLENDNYACSAHLYLMALGLIFEKELSNLFN